MTLLNLADNTPLQGQFAYNIDRVRGFIDVEDQRNLILRIYECMLITFKMIRDLLTFITHVFKSFGENRKFYAFPQETSAGWVYDTTTLPWATATESQGLTVFVHGLRGFPYVWGDYLEALEAQGSSTHFIAPQLPLRGNCALDIAIQPVLTLIRDYFEKFQNASLTLIGTSNGGRAISSIVSQLSVEEMQGRSLNFVSIAGVHNGTTLVDWLHKWHLATFIGMSPIVAGDFRFGSPFAAELLERWKEKQTELNDNHVRVRHLFCSALEDEKVMPLSSTLPWLENAEAEYQIYTCENHETVVSAARENILQWLNT